MGAFNSNSAMVGADNVHYSKLLNDVAPKADGTGGSVTYGDVVPLLKMTSIGFTPSETPATDYADNVAVTTVVSKGDLALALERTGFSVTELAGVLGRKIVNGGVVESADDNPPYIAVGGRIDLGDAYRLIWAFKGKLTSPAVSAQTRAGNVNFQHQSVSGNFVFRDCDKTRQYTIDIPKDEDAITATAEFFTVETLQKLYDKADAPDTPDTPDGGDTSDGSDDEV